MSHTTEIKSVPINDILALRKTAESLRAKGINCELRERVKPRMFYQDQLTKQMGLKSDVCDFVLHLADCPYDIAFVKQPEGHYTPVFDDWRDQVRGIMGCPVDKVAPMLAEERAKAVATAGSWGNDSQDAMKLQTSISKFLQEYSMHSVIHEAEAQGHMVESCTIDEDGDIHLQVAVL